MNIRVNSLYKSYGDNHVLEDFSYEFLEGQRYCIMGPSGCGKTTLLNILLGLDTPNQGQIQGLKDRIISPVFQEDRLCNNLSVASNLNLVQTTSLSSNVLQQALDALSLGNILRQPAKSLSGGMKRRVALLRAILHNGDIFIMDEPFKGLDVETKQRTIRYIHEITKEKTMIWVTHDSSEVEWLPSTIISLE